MQISKINNQIYSNNNQNITNRKVANEPSFGKLSYLTKALLDPNSALTLPKRYMGIMRYKKRGFDSQQRINHVNKLMGSDKKKLLASIIDSGAYDDYLYIKNNKNYEFNLFKSYRYQIDVEKRTTSNHTSPYLKPLNNKAGTYSWCKKRASLFSIPKLIKFTAEMIRVSEWEISKADELYNNALRTYKQEFINRQPELQKLNSTIEETNTKALFKRFKKGKVSAEEYAKLNKQHEEALKTKNTLLNELNTLKPRKYSELRDYNDYSQVTDESWYEFRSRLDIVNQDDYVSPFRSDW